MSNSLELTILCPNKVCLVTPRSSWANLSLCARKKDARQIRLRARLRPFTGHAYVLLPGTLTSFYRARLRPFTGHAYFLLPGTLTSFYRARLLPFTGHAYVLLPGTLTSFYRARLRPFTGHAYVLLPGTLTSFYRARLRPFTGHAMFCCFPEEHFYFLSFPKVKDQSWAWKFRWTYSGQLCLYHREKYYTKFTFC